MREQDYFPEEKKVLHSGDWIAGGLLVFFVFCGFLCGAGTVALFWLLNGGK